MMWRAVSAIDLTMFFSYYLQQPHLHRTLPSLLPHHHHRNIHLILLRNPPLPLQPIKHIPLLPHLRPNHTLIPTLMRTLPIPIRLPCRASPITRHNPTKPAPDQRPQRRETRRRNRDPRLHSTVPRNQHPLLIQRLPPHAHIGHDAQHAGGRAHGAKAQQCRRPDLVPLGHGGAPDELDAEGGVDDVDEGVGYGPRDGDDVGRGEERAGAVGFFEEGDAAGWGEGEEDEAEEGREDGEG